MLKDIKALPLWILFVMAFSFIALTWKYFFIVTGIAYVVLFYRTKMKQHFKLITAIAIILTTALANHFVWPYINPLFVEDNLQKITTNSDVLGSTNQLLTVTVIRVVDGDTIKVSFDGNEETVRLIGIDTPETNHPQKGVECFGHEASDYLRSRIEGTTVLLEADNSQSSQDVYGRKLYYVWLNDININLEMVREGFAYEYTYDVPYKYQYDFTQAQKIAEEQGFGLWSEHTCGGNRESVDESDTIFNESDDISDEPSNNSIHCFCSENLYDCSDFEFQSTAQECFELCGGADNDVHRLDGNGDGLVCTSLP